MTSFSPWPIYSKEEIDAATEVLQSGKVNYWTGNKVKKFEIKFANIVGTNFAIALSNGTVAIELALRALKISNQDEVIVTSRTFIASVSSIVNSGARPVFADVDRDTQNINIESIKKVFTEKTKAIICVHLAGWPCDMDPIMQFAKNNNIFVIEDCAQAHGAVYKGKSVGSIGDIGCWSFCQDKIISTGGEGGMVTTNNKKLWNIIWSLKDHGKSKDLLESKDNQNGFRWLHSTFGSNYRMTEFQAAIGLIQIGKLTQWNKKRIDNLNTIYEGVKDLPNIRIPKYRCKECSCNFENGVYCKNAAYKCYLFVNGDEFLRNKIMTEVNKEGVPCFYGSCSEVYLETAFKEEGLQPKIRLKVAKELGETSLMFLIHPNLTQTEIDKTIKVIRKVALQNI